MMALYWICDRIGAPLRWAAFWARQSAHSGDWTATRVSRAGDSQIGNVIKALIAKQYLLAVEPPAAPGQQQAGAVGARQQDGYQQAVIHGALDQFAHGQRDVAERHHRPPAVELHAG